MSTDAASTATPDILWFSDRLRRDALDAEGVARLKQATFDILERVGVCFPSERAREIFRAHGAVAAGDGAVRLSQDLVERSRRRRIVRAGRARALDLVLDGTRTFLHRGCGRARARPETGGALLAQGRHRAHGAGVTPS
jgi:trimethylamine:corrinoid methyltransferase-like protein